MLTDKINPSNVIVTTADLHENYRIVSPVYIQVNNRSKQFGELRAKYAALTEQLQKTGQRSNDRTSGLEVFEVLFLNAGAYNGHADFDLAFFIAVEELKERAAALGADAVIGMRQDIDLDSNGFQYFYLQMYGTAVQTEKLAKRIEKEESEKKKAVEEENKNEELKKEKATKALEAISSGEIGNDAITFFEYCKQFDSVKDLKEAWEKYDKTNLTEAQTNGIDSEIRNADNIIRMYGKTAVKTADLIKRIETIYVAESI